MVPLLLAFVCANELVATTADQPYIFPAKNAFFVLPYMWDLQHDARPASWLWVQASESAPAANRPPAQYGATSRRVISSQANRLTKSDAASGDVAPSAALAP